MNLYVDYLPALGVFNKCGSVENPWCPLSGKRPLTCYIKETTHQKLKNKVSGLLSFCQAHISDDMPISDGDIYDISHRLIEENQYLLHGKFRQEAILVIMSIVTKALHCAKQKEVHEFDAEMTEEIISFAAVLRLMGSTLLEILNYFSRMRAADDNTNANHGQLRRDYSILCGKICLLSHYEANEPHRCDFISTIGEAVDRERASIQMLSHFASLSVFCVRRRLGFLWRLCIIMMMMAMNLVILEGQRMDIFQLLIDASKESADIPDTDKGSLPLALVPYTDKRNLQVTLVTNSHND
ncbi:hypothetical protein PR202_ga00675 [Eleusine coracana subsp. coracana]|uniref:DUF7812 domain-containing protein n=1 Tax=Eleusine coracana subsp. coracana TaxID=191504 RepID=A0AAV5BEM0_ELECO|nr:hypothetical protein PR202_ga00675 [Eleusine coracana subsp. coracana]